VQDHARENTWTGGGLVITPQARYNPRLALVGDLRAAFIVAFGHCSKDSVSCVPPARPVQRLSGLVSACGTRFSDHVQSYTTL
jgi:hypothetical protein